MTTADATAEVFWTAFRSLPKRGREAVIEKLLKDKEFMEDLIDIALLEQRRKEPSRSLDEYLVPEIGACGSVEKPQNMWLQDNKIV
jgi:hypothetical protein